MAEEKSMYEQMGVDASKEGVRDTFSKVIDHEGGKSWVNYITDPFNPDRVMTQHSDGDGSKMIQRILVYRETGDEDIFKGVVDDALAMNAADIAASGFVYLPIIVTDVLNIGDIPDIKPIIMKKIAERIVELKRLYASFGIDLYFLGGETADLPDQVKSAVFDITVTSWAEKDKLITGYIQDGDVIYGFRSGGKAKWEEVDNSAIMDNGLTMGRTTLMDKSYNEKYPELKGKNDYLGRYGAGDSIGLELLSPTRQWPILIRILMDNLSGAGILDQLHGISVNTGGGATKVRNLGVNIRFHKNMPEPDWIFKLIQSETKEHWQHMYKSFNCGIGLDIIGADTQQFKEALIKTRNATGVRFDQLGFCEKIEEPNSVILTTLYGRFEY